MTDEMIRTAYGEMPVYVAVPATAGPWPGVVVVHDSPAWARTCATRLTGWRARGT